MGKKSKSVLGDRVEKEEVLTVLLAQAVGSDGSALQAWTIKALEKKRDGDGQSVLTCFFCAVAQAHAFVLDC